MRSATATSLGPVTRATRSGRVPGIRAEDIAWRLVGGQLEVRIDLANESPAPTEDAMLVIETAALGAFVPFEPGTRIAVAGLEPWERRRVTATIPADQVAGGVGPGGEWMIGLLAWMFGHVQTGGDPGLRDRLAVLRRSLSAYSSLEWAGNLNVYFDSAPEDAVEVHRALGLRVRAGSLAGFMFVVDGTSACSSRALASDPAWFVEILPGVPGRMMLFVGCPAEAGARTTVEALVTRLSDGRTVPVVFSLETIEGAGDTLGCVRL